MSVVINPPPTHLEKELISQARSTGIAPAEQAGLFLCLASVLRPGSPETPFGVAMRSFLRRHQVDPDHLSSALEHLKSLCFQPKPRPDLPHPPDVVPETMSDGEGLDGILRAWRDDSVHRPIEERATTPLDVDPRQDPNRPRPSILGKYAHLGLSSEEFAREKQREIDREGRDLWE